MATCDHVVGDYHTSPHVHLNGELFYFRDNTLKSASVNIPINGIGESIQHVCDFWVARLPEYSGNYLDLNSTAKISKSSSFNLVTHENKGVQVIKKCDLIINALGLTFTHEGRKVLVDNAIEIVENPIVNQGIVRGDSGAPLVEIGSNMLVGILKGDLRTDVYGHFPRTIKYVISSDSLLRFIRDKFQD